MIIKDELIEPFYIKVDESQYILYEKRVVTKKDGTVGEEDHQIAYFISLAYAIKKIIRLRMANMETNYTLKEYTDHFVHELDEFTKKLDI